VVRRVLEQKLAEAKSKKDTLKARAASAKTSKQVTEMIGSLNTSNAVVAFDKMEEKVRGIWLLPAGRGLPVQGQHPACAQGLGGRGVAGWWPHQPQPLRGVQVMAMEAESEAIGQLVAGDGLEKQFAALEGGAVDDELAALKKGMLTSGALAGA